MAATFRRGFKTDSTALVAEVRSEVRVKALLPLDPILVAREYGVPVATPADLGWGRVALPEEFSAMTVFRGARRIIVMNGKHPLTRQRNSLAHELAHLLLEHQPVRHFENGARMWDPTMEHEADWLGGELLIPRQAALAICRADEHVEDAAARFGVSVALMTMRLNASGARKQVERERGGGRW